jgi:glutaminyl-tRNA synthetase
VLRPLKVVIENYPEGTVEYLEAVNNPEDPAMGTRQIPFSRVVYIEQDDFREDPPKKFFRLAPGQEVRLRYAYIIKCTSVIKNERTGDIIEVRCTYDPATRGGSSQEGRKVKGTLHWVSAAHAVEAEVRLYGSLLDPNQSPCAPDVPAAINPQSLERLAGCLVEPSLASVSPGSRYQFERQGYFCVDVESSAGNLIFNRTVPLRDSWAKIEKSQTIPTS